jgi:hypothetical protein
MRGGRRVEVRATAIVTATAATIAALSWMAAASMAAQPTPDMAGRPTPDLDARTSARCPAGQLAGGICLAIHAGCSARSHAIYSQRGLVCVHGRLREGGLAVQREGGAFAINAQGRVGLAEAEQAFIATVGPLPGVKPIPGAVALLPDADITGPRNWIRSYMPRLRPAQRRAVKRLLTPSREARASSEKNAVLSELEPTLIALIEQHTGVKLRFKPTVETGTATELTVKGKVAGGFADPVVGSGESQIVGCRVLILEKEVAEYTNAVRVEGHELTHCAQESQAGTIARWNALPRFFVEGYALWAGNELQIEVTGLADTDEGLDLWINDPLRDLFKREYDAGGLFDEVGEEVGDRAFPWTLLKPLVEAGSAGAMYSLLKADGEPTFERNLATNPLLAPELGQQWTFAGPGITPATAAPKLPQASIDDGDSATLGAPARASDRTELDLQADIVTIAGDAPGGLHLSDGRTLDVQPTRLCDLQEGCMCPDGSNPTSEGGQKGEATLAIWGRLSGEKVTLSGESLAEACGEHPASPTSPSGAGGTIRLTNLQKQTIASFQASASCSIAGGTLTARLPKVGGGTPLVVTLPGFVGGQPREYTFTNPANGGGAARFPPYATDAPPNSPEEPANAGGAGYEGGTHVFLDATLFLSGGGGGGFAVGGFDCPAKSL